MHRCPKCGTEIEDGTPFCSHCGAPQIRVSVTGIEKPEQEVQPPQRNNVEQRSTVPAKPPSPYSSFEKKVPIEKSTARSSAAMAALGAVVLMLTPALARLFPLWLLLAGGFAVWLYRRRHRMEISIGAGARIGVLAGVIAFVMLALLFLTDQVIESYVLHHNEFVNDFRNRVHLAIAASPDPQVHQMEHMLLTPEGITLFLVIGLAFLFVLFLILTTVGGLAGAAIMRRRSSE